MENKSVGRSHGNGPPNPAPPQEAVRRAGLRWHRTLRYPSSIQSPSDSATIAHTDSSAESLHRYLAARSFQQPRNISLPVQKLAARCEVDGRREAVPSLFAPGECRGDSRAHIHLPEHETRAQLRDS